MNSDLRGKKVLFVSYFYPPAAGTGLPGTMRSVKFIRNLECAGVHVLSIDSSLYPVSTKLDKTFELPVNRECIHRCGAFDLFSLFLSLRAKVKKAFARQSDARKGVGPVFHLAQQPPPDSVVHSGLFQRLKDFVYHLLYFPDTASPWIPGAVREGLRIIRHNKVDVIFATGMPWSALIVGWCLSRFTGRPLVVDFRDPWIGNPFHLSKGRFLDGLARWVERKIVFHAKVVSVNTESLRDQFIDRYPTINPSRLVAMPNGYDLADFAWLTSLEDSSVKNSTNDDLVLCHAGYLYGLRDPAPILDAITLCRERINHTEARIRFVQIGLIKLDYSLEVKYAELLSDGTLELKDEVPYRQCLEELAASDVLVNVQSGTQTQVPSKLYDYLALGRPILNLTPRDGALGRMVVKYGFGDLFDETDVHAIADRLLELLALKQKGNLVADYPARDQFDVRVITQRLSECLLEATNASA